MGTLNFKVEPAHLQRITTALARRGLLPDTGSEWEVHGPHLPEMPYQVYVGTAREKTNQAEWLLVAIYPRGVYEIDDPADWAWVTPDQRLPAHR